MLTSLEICAGAGGQALGLEAAGFHHAATVENDPHAAETLRQNRDHMGIRKSKRWNVIEGDVLDLDGKDYRGIDLLAGGVPCPPFSVAGKQLGADDERDLFPKALELVKDADPRAVLLENVRGLSSARFQSYRENIVQTLEGLGYTTWWQVINASEHGVPQLRPRFVLVGLKHEYAAAFRWPEPVGTPKTVGEALYAQMAAEGWPGADQWMERANSIGPTLVGGSKKHGGADLGPSRAREGWARLGVDGRGVADAPPTLDTPVDHVPRLTLGMAAAIQGFPRDWKFTGRKTAAYRQIGNAFPPPVAAALGRRIASALRTKPAFETVAELRVMA